MKLKVVVGAGDGIGPEVTREAVLILTSVAEFGPPHSQFTEMPDWGPGHSPNGHASAGSHARCCAGTQCCAAGRCGQQ